MSIACAVVTTFPDNSWLIYSKQMLESFVRYWPAEVPLLVKLDTNLLEDDVKKILRPQDGLVCGWTKEHGEFVERNKDKEHKDDYRKQPIRFCHKVFALKFASDSSMQARAAKAEDAPRYIIWMDADVITTSQVSFDDIAKCLPVEGDAVAYMGRKDWDHSECGWLAFDLQEDAQMIINEVYSFYNSDAIIKSEQQHDSWAFDCAMFRGSAFNPKCTNLTLDKPGREIWQHSPMAKFSRHYKGPIAKQEFYQETQNNPAMKVSHGDRSVPLRIQTKNSIPNESIHKNIIENQFQIKNWVSDCLPNDEEIVVVSAGPTLVAEDLADEIKAGRKIVAVKHAIGRLKESGIKPWACMLLDPRDHVYDFVENPDTDVIWFVASQVTPKAVKKLIDSGCIVWGYHAAVGANESELIERQHDAIVHGGSATATRGLYLLEKLGFRNFRLYGYDLCFPDKPDLNLKDEHGQPKYFEASIVAEKINYSAKRTFWSQGELLAQYQEMVDIINKTKWKIRAFGQGIVPFLSEAERLNDLRTTRKKLKINAPQPVSYEDLLKCHKKKTLLAKLHRLLPRIRQKQTKASSF